MTMRVNPIFGFLGSGKTTLVRRILEERASIEPTAVIVNEFGDIGIDADIIAGDAVNIMQLTSGCLCCTLKGSLVTALEELRLKTDTKRTIIEATGVAQPGELADTFGDPALAELISMGPLITVVDAAKFEMLRNGLGPFYEDQLSNADVVILNKTDLAPADELEATRQAVLELNPTASILFTEQCDLDLDLVLEGAMSMAADAGSHLAHDHDHDHDHGAHPNFDSFVLDAAAGAGRGALESFFAALPETVYRAKGFLVIDGEPSLLQFSNGQLEITPSEERPNASLVFIGRGLDRAAIEAGLKETAP